MVLHICTPKILLFCQIDENVSIPKGNLNKPTDAFVNLMNQLSNFTGNEKENELNLPNCKYRDTDYFKNLTKILPKIFRGRPCLFSI